MIFTAEVLCNITHKTLEGELADEEFSTLLVMPDLAEGDGSRAVTVWLLDTPSSWGGLASSLGGELLTGSLSSCRLTGSLLCTSHAFKIYVIIDILAMVI